MQKKIQTSICLMLTLLLFVTSCKKTELNEPSKPPKIILNNASKLDSFFVSNRKVAGFSNTNENTTSTSSTYQVNNSNNNGWSGSFEDEEVPTILGSQLPNPYTIANMQIAYQLAGSNLIPHVTDLYVKFKPNNYEQLSALDDSLDLELQDYPMDYEVIQDGDYYVTTGADPEEIPWLYTVVPNGFNFPNGIPYQIISELHIPEDDIFLEALAESIVAGGQYMAGSVSNAKTITRIDLEEPVTVTENRECNSPVLFCVLPPQCLDPNDPACNTGGGGGGGGNGGGGNGGGQLPNIARGQIRVWDTHIIAGGREEPVKNVRVVIKRWFKVNKVYTNNQGNFQATKRFNNRFKVNVKFRNNLASIRSIRGVRVWQMLFPVHKNIGRFENNFNNVSFLFGRNEGPVDAWRTNWMRLWMAATTHNALQEHKALAQAEMVGTFSSNNRMNVLLTNHALGIKSGAEFRAPMHKQKRKDFNESDGITTAKIVNYVLKAKKSVVAIPLAIYNLIKLGIQTAQPDLTFTYSTDIENLSSNQVARNVFGAMTLASLYKATGLAIYDNITKSIFKFIDLGISGGTVIELKFKTWKDIFNSGVSLAGLANSIIGFFNTAGGDNKPKYELYHGYAMYMGNFLAWKKYGFNASNVKNQKRESIGNLGNLNSHTRYLEEYSPTITEDAYRFVPIGFYYDLIDGVSGTESVSGIIDDVDYFTNANLWSALVNGTAPLQMADFLTKLNAIKPAQTTTTTNLFLQYVQ